MRIFQNNGLSRGFRATFHRQQRGKTFASELARFLDTRFSAPHILAPVLSGEDNAFFTNGDDEVLQRLWAEKEGLRASNLEQVLLAQIEHHRTEVFYNLDPIRYGSSFVRKLPGCVLAAMCWRAAPSGDADLSAYDLVLGNFPTILRSWQQKGCKATYFAPAHDPVMDDFADRHVTQVDVIFVGGFSRHHKLRVEVLKAVATTPGVRKRLHLEDSRLTQIANLLTFVPGLGSYRHPPEIRSVRAGPLYGRELYAALSGARIVLNGAVDMAGVDRGNMRCFEAVGCGAVLLTDAGAYPDGFADGETMVTYSSPSQVPELIRKLVQDVSWSSSIADAGRDMVRNRYSKEQQWRKFQELV